MFLPWLDQSASRFKMASQLIKRFFKDLRHHALEMGKNFRFRWKETPILTPEGGKEECRIKEVYE